MTVDPREFEALEEETGAFDIRVDGVPVWERIRFGVYRSILEQNGVGQAHSTNEGSPRDYLKGLTNWLKNWVHRNPFLADPADVMFVGHQRRKLQEDGLWWDIYCDPIHEACDFDSVHFEPPYLLDHRRPAKTEEIRYLDLIQYGGTLQRKLGFHQVSIPGPKARKLGEIEREIADRFDALIDVEGRVIKSLRRRQSELWQWEKLLDRVDPKVVVLVVSYGKEPFIEACQRAEVPVVELQHGVIHRSHFGYHFPGSRTKELFPDYLFTWGRDWSEFAEFPLRNDHVIPVGYPYLEQKRGAYENVLPENSVLFISQGPIGEQLSKFAEEVASQLENVDVIYKLHPGEYDRWREAYPWLKSTSMRVVADESVPLYRLFAESSVQVGVSSTALYEGLDFGLATYLVNFPGIGVLDELVELGYAKPVESPQELVDAINAGRRDVPADLRSLFQRSSTEKIQRAIDSIIESTEPSAD